VDIASGFGACTSDFNEIDGGCPKNALGKVASAGIASAEDEDERFHGKSEQ